jgi:periplasmic divalent cation tolerance protein
VFHTGLSKFNTYGVVIEMIMPPRAGLINGYVSFLNFTMSTYIQVQITFPTEELAQRTAERLVTEHLAACAQILGSIRSFYVWKEKREESREILLLAKTKTVLFDRLVDAVREEHPYDCPQIIALPILAGNADYLEWLDDAVTKDGNRTS